MEKLQVGDVTNFGRIESLTTYGHYKIEGRDCPVGNWQDIYKVNAKNEEEVKMMTKNPIEIKL